MALKEKQIKKDKATPSIKKSPFFYNSLLVYGEWWMLVILIPFLYLILYGIFRDFYKFEVSWIYYLVIASGSVPATLRLFIKPPNLFGEGWLQPRTTAMLTEEERKALTFLKTSKNIKKITLITGLFLFSLIFTFPLLRFITYYNANEYLIKKINFSTALAVSFIYGFFCYLFGIFIISQYLIKHWNEIQQSGIESWPKDKPYSTGPFSYRVPKDSSLMGDILAIDPNMPFNWHDFLIFLGVFLSICLIFWGLSAVAILFSKTTTASFTLKTASLITGIAVLNISARIWYKKHKKK